MSEGDAERERIKAARDIAFEEGRHRERIEGRLNSHEARLNAINGSIDRGTKATNGLRLDVQKLHEEFSKLVEAQRVRDAVEADRTRQLRKANEKQISTRAFVIGVATVIVMLIGVIVAVLNVHPAASLIVGGF